MRNFIRLVFVIIFSCFSCQKETPKISTQKKQKIEEATFVVNASYKKGDTRRYGVFPDTIVNNTYLKNINTLIKNSVPVTFSKGSYALNLDLNGLQNVSIFFDNATINGRISIIDVNNTASKNIHLKGNLTVLDKIFIRKSSDIVFENVIVKSDTINALTKNKNRGVSVYAGSKNIRFNTLKIKETGGDKSDFFKYTAAAFQVHGWNNNPDNITIENLTLVNSSRTAAYITGKNHSIKNIDIKGYGSGSSKNMFGLEDAKENTQKIFTGLWINKCNNCTFNSVKVVTKNSKTFALKLGLGKSNEPTIINNLTLDIPYKDELILDSKLTNVLVKKLQLAND